MKEMILEIIKTYYFWIVVELVVIAILTFFIMKNSRRKKAIKEDMEHNLLASQYRELDEMIANKKRGNR